jgi:hypothetical protein
VISGKKEAAGGCSLFVKLHQQNILKSQKPVRAQLFRSCFSSYFLQRAEIKTIPAATMRQAQMVSIANKRVSIAAKEILFSISLTVRLGIKDVVMRNRKFLPAAEKRTFTESNEIGCLQLFKFGG